MRAAVVVVWLFDSKPPELLQVQTYRLSVATAVTYTGLHSRPVYVTNEELTYVNDNIGFDYCSFLSSKSNCMASTTSRILVTTF